LRCLYANSAPAISKLPFSQASIKLLTLSL